MSEVVKLERHDEVGIVTVNSPPVNALSAAVRGGILECIKAAIADPAIKGIVLTCAGRTFIAGSGYLEWYPSEFSKLSAAYERHTDVNPLGADRILLQATFALGPHKPHPF